MTIGVVLAGGRSRRFGRDKAQAAWRGETLIGRAARRLRVPCREVVTADRGQGLVPGCPSVDDGPGAGPAAGILGAADRYPGATLLVLACDLPLVPASFLQALADGPPADWLVPRHEAGLEPLCARYGPAALAALAHRIAAGDYALHRLATEPGLDVRWLEGAALRDHGDPAQWLLNVNRPADWKRLAARGFGG